MRGERGERLRRVRRKVTGTIMLGLCGVAAALVVLPLLLILWHLVSEGATSLNLDFFTELPTPVGEAGGGMANAIVGTLELLGIAAATALPISILAGVFLAEARGTGFATVVRFLGDVMTGVPSIVVGIFVYAWIVRRTGHFSGLAGGVALGILMIPTVTRTTEEMMRLVPGTLREGGLALGLTHWRTTLGLLLPAAAGGIATGALVALARVAGETAPLLFTAFGNRFWELSPLQPIAALPLQIFQYAISPYEDWHRQAWAASLVLIALVLVISLVARVATRARYGRAG